MKRKFTNINQLKGISKKIRQNIIKMIIRAKSGDYAGSLGITDVFTALYFGGILNHDPKRPNMRERDRLILSECYVCPALYACLSEAGYFAKRELWSLRNLGSPLQGCPVYKSIPGIENTSGSLSQSISVAVGIAYSIRYFEKSNQMVYCITGNEEHNQGQTWEAIMFAGKHKLPNLTMIVDRNNVQNSGNAEDIDTLENKYKAFNWKVINIDGNNIEEVIGACSKAREISEKPVCIIANTTFGKGVKFMEGNFEYHTKLLKDEEANEALRAIGIKV